MIDFPIDKIIPLCREFGVEITEEQKNQLDLYANLLVEWNERMNLTAITEPNDVVFKHFYDCILFFKNVEVPQNARIIDVGTGAGFPGMVLKIIRPDIQLTLLDGLAKRLTFLNEVLTQLKIDAKTVHLRAEDGGKNTEHREQYDFATARAVARLNVLAEYCLPFVKKGGSFVAMKGPTAEEEMQQGGKAITLLGGGKPEIICETLTGNEERNFIIVKKISQTPTKYPRNPAKISKQPL